MIDDDFRFEDRMGIDEVHLKGAAVFF